MEYVYAAMLLHKAGKKIDEASIKKVLEAAGITPDETRIKALVAALEGVDIERAIETAQAVQAPQAGAAPEIEKKSVEEEKKVEEQAAAGLSALFG